MALVMAIVIIDYNPRTHLGASALSIYAPSAAVQLQFSHPLGVRRVVKIYKALDYDYNSRTRSECVETIFHETRLKLGLQSSHPLGVRHE